MIKVLVSSCLLGSPVRYNGAHKKSEDPILERWIGEGRVVSVCPEMLGGLGTPRPPAEIVFCGGRRRVITNEGRDVTTAFERGAALSAREGAAHDVKLAVLKSNSPSCGSGFVYDGTFTGTRVAGDGVTTALLREHGIRVFDEDELAAADEYIRMLESARQ